MRKYNYGFRFGKKRTLTHGLYFVMDAIFQQVKNSILRGNIDSQDVRHMKLLLQEMPASENTAFNNRVTGYRILLKGAGHQFAGCLNRIDSDDPNIYTYYVNVMPTELSRAYGKLDKHDVYHTFIEPNDFESVINTFGFLKNLFADSATPEEHKKLLIHVNHFYSVMENYRQHLISWADMIQDNYDRDHNIEDDIPELVKEVRRRFDFEEVKTPYEASEGRLIIYDLMKGRLLLRLGFDEKGNLWTFGVSGSMDKNVYPALIDCIKEAMFKEKDSEQERQA